MWNLTLRLFVTVAALKVADFLLSGFDFHGGIISLVMFGIVLGLLNWIVKPVLVFFSIPFLIVTIGMFYFVINAFIFYLAGWILPGILSADLLGILVGSTLVSVLHWFLSLVFRVKKHE